MTIDLNTLLGRPEAPSSSAKRADPAARHDFRSLVLALQSGDVASAKKALDAVRQDLSTPGSASPEPAKAGKAGTLAINDALDVLDQALYARDRSTVAGATVGKSDTAAAPSAIDYGRFSSMTPYDVYMANPNGLPAGWDWSKWSEAAGKPDPSHTDVAGNPLGADGFRSDVPASTAPAFDRAGPAFDWNRTGAYLAREGGDGSVHTMTITPPSGWNGNLELYGTQAPSSLGEVSGVSYVVTDSSGKVVATTNGVANAAGNGLSFSASGAQGPYTVTLTLSGAGKETFNCLHQP